MPIEVEKLKEGKTVSTNKHLVSVKERVKAFLSGGIDPLTEEDWEVKLRLSAEEISHSGWSQQEIAENLKIPEQQINQAIVSGRNSLVSQGIVTRRTVQVGKRVKIYNILTSSVENSTP